MATSDDLLQDVYANFLGAYNKNQASPSATVLAFEVMGLSPGLTVGDPTSPELAVEYISSLSDVLPDLSSGSYSHTMRTISVTYSDMLSVAAPTTQEGAPTFNAVKASAGKALDNSSLGSEEGPTTFEPAYAFPTDWYDPGQSSNWTLYSYSVGTPNGSPSNSGTPTNPPRVPVSYLPIARWRLMVAAPAAQAAKPAMAAAAIPQAPLHVEAAPSAAIARRPIELPPRIPIAPANPSSTTPPALHPSFAMSFDYCIVELDRPWLSGDFLASNGWYVPGAHKGDYASGPAAASSSTTQGAPQGANGATPQAAASTPQGAFAYVPTAFIAIKNLSINVAALEDGTNSEQPVAFGPFSLAHATGSNDALNAPGIQIIAWICTVQPVLPPQTDPALVPPPPPSNATNVVNTISSDVGAVSGLIGELKGL